VALGHTPNRRRIDLSKPTTPPVDQYCKNGGDHRFFCLRFFALVAASFRPVEAANVWKVHRSDACPFG
ncbi:hypothetical protein, partial [Pseudomonas sp.]|uniref:hypothetical protein n=1 Tax=Pseudomonas sp. TaxID=306 RepID=UPI0025857B19